MSDLISREKAIDYFVTNIGVVDADGYAVDDYDERVKIWTERFSGIPSAEPDNQVHLCGFCKYGYPECPAKMSDVIFGNGKGQDNVCACAKFEIKPERKKGKWIEINGTSSFIWLRCSECGYGANVRTNFCPNCGAYMRGEQ